MEDRLIHLRELASSLRLSNLKNNTQQIVLEAEKEDVSPVSFLELVLQQELDGRQKRACKRRIKESHLPYIKTLEQFELERLQDFGLDKMNRLRQLNWIKDNFNLFLVGKPGTGKTHLACALGYEAIQKGYSVSFVTMTDLVELLKDQTINEKSQRRIERIKASRLFIIDGVADFPVIALEAGLFLQFLNQLHETCSLLLTANNGPDVWPEVFENNPQLLGALDRLMFKCEVLHLEATSYRVEHRQSFLTS